MLLRGFPDTFPRSRRAASRLCCRSVLAERPGCSRGDAKRSCVRRTRGSLQTCYPGQREQAGVTANERETSSRLMAVQNERRDLVEQPRVTRGRRFQEINGQRLTTLDELIRRLNNGESISPEEIDRAMRK